MKIAVLLILVLSLGLSTITANYPSHYVSWMRPSNTIYNLQSLNFELYHYKDIYGDFPDNLDELINKAHLNVSLITDPWGNRFIYSKATSTFNLYSIGLNLKNEGGLGDDLNVFFDRKEAQKFICDVYVGGLCNFMITLNSPIKHVPFIFTFLFLAYLIAHFFISRIKNVITNKSSRPPQASAG